MELRRLAGAVVLCWAFAAPSAYAAPILIDDFEVPEITALSGYEYQTTGGLGWGWTNANNVLVYEVPTYQQPSNPQTVHGGNQAVQLEAGIAGPVAASYIQRSISTVASQLYTLDFWHAAFTPPGASALGVGINGGALVPFLGTAAFVGQSLQFTATGASTLIRFENTGVYGVSYPHLDDISYNAVPEPASLLLLGTGLLAVARRRFKARA